jgi:hypothetical protein
MRSSRSPNGQELDRDSPSSRLARAERTIEGESKDLDHPSGRSVRFADQPAQWVAGGEQLQRLVSPFLSPIGAAMEDLSERDVGDIDPHEVTNLMRQANEQAIALEKRAIQSQIIVHKLDALVETASMVRSRLDGQLAAATASLQMATLLFAQLLQEIMPEEGTPLNSMTTRTLDLMAGPALTKMLEEGVQRSCVHFRADVKRTLHALVDLELDELMAHFATLDKSHRAEGREGKVPVVACPPLVRDAEMQFEDTLSAAKVLPELVRRLAVGTALREIHDPSVASVIIDSMASLRQLGKVADPRVFDECTIAMSGVSPANDGPLRVVSEDMVLAATSRTTRLDCDLDRIAQDLRVTLEGLQSAERKRLPVASGKARTRGIEEWLSVEGNKIIQGTRMVHASTKSQESCLGEFLSLQARSNFIRELLSHRDPPGPPPSPPPPNQPPTPASAKTGSVVSFREPPASRPESIESEPFFSLDSLDSEEEEEFPPKCMGIGQALGVDTAVRMRMKEPADGSPESILERPVGPVDRLDLSDGAMSSAALDEMRGVLEKGCARVAESGPWQNTDWVGDEIFAAMPFSDEMGQEVAITTPDNDSAPCQMQQPDDPSSSDIGTEGVDKLLEEFSVSLEQEQARPAPQVDVVVPDLVDDYMPDPPDPYHGVALLQAQVRGWIVRSHLQRIGHQRLPQDDSTESMERRFAAEAVIERAVSRWRSHRRAAEGRMHRAAVRIQSLFRGYNLRRRLPKMDQELTRVRLEMIHEAASSALRAAISLSVRFRSSSGYLEHAFRPTPPTKFEDPYEHPLPSDPLARSTPPSDGWVLTEQFPSDTTGVSTTPSLVARDDGDLVVQRPSTSTTGVSTTPSLVARDDGDLVMQRPSTSTTGVSTTPSLVARDDGDLVMQRPSTSTTGVSTTPSLVARDDGDLVMQRPSTRSAASSPEARVEVVARVSQHSLPPANAGHDGDPRVQFLLDSLELCPSLIDAALGQEEQAPASPADREAATVQEEDIHALAKRVFRIGDDEHGSPPLDEASAVSDELERIDDSRTFFREIPRNHKSSSPTATSPMALDRQLALLEEQARLFALDEGVAVDPPPSLAETAREAPRMVLNPRPHGTLVETASGTLAVIKPPTPPQSPAINAPPPPPLDVGGGASPVMIQRRSRSTTPIGNDTSPRPASAKRVRVVTPSDLAPSPVAASGSPLLTREAGHAPGRSWTNHNAAPSHEEQASQPVMDVPVADDELSVSTFGSGREPARRHGKRRTPGDHATGSARIPRITALAVHSGYRPKVDCEGSWSLYDADSSWTKSVRRGATPKRDPGLMMRLDDAEMEILTDSFARQDTTPKSRQKRRTPAE